MLGILRHSLSFMRHEPVVQSQLKPSVLKSREADGAQHFLELFRRDSWLVLVESQFIVDQLDASQNLQDGVDRGTGPSHDQRPAWTEDPVSFGQQTGWFGQVFQNR